MNKTNTHCLIRFVKPRNEDKPITMTVFRADGTTTGQRSTAFFLIHDFTHYAVETILGFYEAFFGLLGSGWDIHSFEEREPGSRKARRLPEQAHLAEVLVGLLDRQRACPSFSDIDLLGEFEASRTMHGLPEISLDVGCLGSIRARRDSLTAAWEVLKPGGTLELRFPD